VAKSRFNRRGPRPGRFLVYVLAGALVLALGGLAAEHGGPNFNGALVAGKAKSSQPAPPAPKPNNSQVSSNQASSDAKTTPTTSTTCSTAPAGSQCHVDKNGNGHVRTTSDAMTYPPNQPADCPAKGAKQNPQNKVHCQNPPKNQPDACYYKQTNTQYKNGQATKTDTQYKVQKDKDNKKDQKNEKCEASGETTAQ
jgi:hypothetical protein